MGVVERNALLIQAVIESNGFKHAVECYHVENCFYVALYNGFTFKIDGTDEPLSPSQLQMFSENLVSLKLGEPHRPNAGHPVESSTVISPKIARPPGSYLMIFAEFAYSKKKCENVLFPAITDMREEYFEALSENRVWKSRWVWLRGLWSFWAAVGFDLPITALRLVKKIWTAAS